SGLTAHRPRATHKRGFTGCRSSVFSPAAKRRAPSELEELSSQPRPKTCAIPRKSDQMLVKPADQDARSARHRRTARSGFLAFDEDSLVPQLVAIGGVQPVLIDGDDRLGQAFGL